MNWKVGVYLRDLGIERRMEAECNVVILFGWLREELILLEYGNEHSHSISGGEYPHCVSDYWVLRRDVFMDLIS
jgi:hypothetical protein